MSEVDSQRQIERLARRLRWRTSARGLLPGRVGGRRRGSAGEFESYRHYQGGDDLRGLDLKVYRRLRRPMVRVLSEDSLAPLTLLVDRSASMRGAARARKVSELALFFLLLARHHGDPARLYTFAGAELESVPAPLPQAVAGIAAVAAVDRSGAVTEFGRSFRRLPPDPAGRGLVLIISDAMGLTDPQRELAPLARVGTPFWIAPLEAEELDPPGEGRVLLVSAEREPAWRGFLDAATRQAYRARLARYHEALRRQLQAHGGDLFVLTAAEPTSESIERLRAAGSLLR